MMTAPNSQNHDSPPERSSNVVECEFDNETPPSIAIVKAICSLKNIDPVDIPPDERFVLYDHIDPTALDAILGEGTGAGQVVVSFEITSKNTYNVTASDDGRITIDHGH